MAKAKPPLSRARPAPTGGRSRSAAAADRAASPQQGAKCASESPNRSRSSLMGRYADLGQVLVLPPTAVRWSQGILEEDGPLLP